MRRWVLPLALLLSLGLNLGVLGSLWVKRQQASRLPAAAAFRPPQLERVADRLGLEGTERLRFVEAQRRFIETVRREGRLLAADRLELRRQLTSPSPDRARVEELVASTARRSGALDLAFAENVLFAREVLDGPREERYVRMLAEMYNRIRSAPQPRRPGPRN